MKKEKKCQTSNMPKECFLSSNMTWVGYLNYTTKPIVIKREIRRIIPHPDFCASNYTNDIALIELSRPIVCLDLPRPICLPTRNLSKVGNELVIAGWGESNSEKFESMFFLYLFIISNL
ncbi:chymotrypsin-like protease CTRL-1 [Trichonephila clavata]|uniref:Chymotrypsin-like protease CTRL-1 n=1 Tax=Trichonephila clavata TaxID=2740835 RepID=A0A8X6L447_TRICU|nr:chymotrypsin-like protease CTRL-1 [Trichonephila clavata]